MSTTYQQIINLLDKLTPGELAALMGVIAQRMQGVVGSAEEDEEEQTGGGSRRYLPRLPQMIEWGVVVPMEDKLYVQGHQDQPALLLDAYRVAFNGEPMPINDWAKSMYGWTSINVYESVIVEREGKSLDDLRQAYMTEHGIE